MNDNINENSKWIVVKDNQIVGYYNTQSEAVQIIEIEMKKNDSHQFCMHHISNKDVADLNGGDACLSSRFVESDFEFVQRMGRIV